MNNTTNATNSLPRLNKAIAQSGYCSRRAADTLIFDGKVSVNGQVVTDPSRRLEPGDILSVNGTVLTHNAQKFVYCIINKPTHTVSTAYDPEGRTTVLDLLPDRYRPYRLYPVGRLDYFSEGLLILTNDGDLAYALTHPKYHLPKVYIVRIRGQITQKTLSAIQKGVLLDDGTHLPPVSATITHTDPNTTTLTLTLYQGINRQIRKMCDALDLTILRLVRIAEGPLTLGNLATGACRDISKLELESLRSEITRAKRT
ncbi:MAG: rRNA pseudouridine synthase [Desulfovibrionaceae bacterium]|nr:rRNA pseudouridine synthase [Desulfovibrionaceae bacterium]